MSRIAIVALAAALSCAPRAVPPSAGASRPAPRTVLPPGALSPGDDAGVSAACAEGLPPDARAGVWARCEVQFVSRTFVSVACEGYADVGGAHPSKSSITMNLEVPAAREVRLEDLFRPGSDWRGPLERLIEADFARQVGGEGWPSGALGEPGAFVVTAEGLRFYYEDALPFVVGSVHPLVRWDALRPYVRRDRLQNMSLR